MDEKLKLLDQVGCQYGRKTKECVNTIKREIISLQEKTRFQEEIISNIEKDLSYISEKMNRLDNKLSWTLGAAAVIGAVAGNLLVFLFKLVLAGG